MSGVLKLGGKTLATNDTGVAKIQLGSANDVVIADSAGNSILTENGSVVTLNNVDTATIGSNALVVDSSGKVGIGTSSPTAPLDVAGNDGVIVRRVSQTNGFLIRPTASGDGVRFTQEGTGDRMTIDASGNIGAPSGTNIYNASDERLKQNITGLSGCLQKVLSMRGVSFNWINEFCDSEANKTLYGLIAQELQIVDSNLVDSFSDNTITAGSVTVENPLRVNEKFIIPMLVESIKEQQTIIESQQAEITSLQTTVADLLARIETLENN